MAQLTAADFEALGVYDPAHRARRSNSSWRGATLAPAPPDGVAMARISTLVTAPSHRSCDLLLKATRGVGRDGALVAVAAPSRDDSPELALALPRRTLTFDAELAPELMAEHFEAVEVDRWDLPLVTLPDRDAVRDYLIGKGTEASAAADASEEVEVPLTVTKRGALVWGAVRS